MKKFLAVILILVTASIVSAAENYNYINPKLIPPTLIANPELNNSVKLKSEAAQIITIQAAATNDEINAAESESHYRPELVSGILKDRPATIALLDKADSDCDLIVHQAKNYWRVTRPYLADKNIRALIKPTASFAYPSGHTTCSLLTAEIFQQVNGDPSKRAVAEKIANHRVMGGMHWPQDLAGGRELAPIIFGALQMSDSYKADLLKAKQEWPGK